MAKATPIPLIAVWEILYSSPSCRSVRRTANFVSKTPEKTGLLEIIGSVGYSGSSSNYDPGVMSRGRGNDSSKSVPLSTRLVQFFTHNTKDYIP